MQRYLHVLVRLEDIQKRKIAILVSLFDDSIEVADGLMVVQDDAKTYRVSHEMHSHPLRRQKRNKR